MSAVSLTRRCPGASQQWSRCIPAVVPVHPSSGPREKEINSVFFTKTRKWTLLTTFFSDFSHFLHVGPVMSPRVSRRVPRNRSQKWSFGHFSEKTVKSGHFGHFSEKQCLGMRQNVIFLKPGLSKTLIFDTFFQSQKVLSFPNRDLGQPELPDCQNGDFQCPGCPKQQKR